MNVHVDTRTAKMDTLATGAFLSELDPLDEPSPFLGGNPSEDGDEKLAYRPPHVEPRLLRRHELDSPSIEVENDLKIADHRPSKTVERPAHDGIVLPGMSVLQHRLEAGPFFHGAHLLFNNLDDLEASLASKVFKNGALVLDVLFGRRGSQIQAGTLRLREERGHASYDEGRAAL